MEKNMADLLPWYVNGTLNDDEREYVEKHLDDNPTYKHQVSFLTGLREEIQRTATVAPMDIGLARTLQKIAAQSKAERPKFSVLRGLGRWLRTLIDGQKYLRPAFALGVAFIAIQAVTVGYFVSGRDSEFSEIRSRKYVPAEAGPFIKISFTPEAKEADIRFLLIQMQASIVGGPSHLGDYYLYLKPARLDWAAQQLRKSPIVDSVTVMAVLPPAKE